MNHQNKANMYVEALESAGYIQTRSHQRARIYLTDTDIGGRAEHLSKYYRRQKVFVYSHSARPNIFYDLFPEWEKTTAQFVPAEGHIEFLRGMGCKKPIHVSGWHLCAIREFQPRETFRRVLFAPIHPNRNSFLSDVQKKINRDVFQSLYTLVRSGDIDLTVRTVMSLELNGLQRARNVTYILGNPDGTYSDIDAADVVVAHDTFAYLAVARGVPTVMMAEAEAPIYGNRADALQTPPHWNEFKHLIEYPWSILNKEPAPMLARAVQSDAEIAVWRKQMIGEPFDGPKFVQEVERYMQ